MNNGLPAAAPSNLKPHHIRQAARGENAERLVAGKISSTTYHLLALHRHGSVIQADL
jgi:hypothetical protein